MLREQLTEALMDAMRGQDKRRTSTLRLILAAIKDRDIAGRENGSRDLVGDDDRRRTMGQAATLRALQEFDQQRVIDLTLLTYRKLLLKAGLPLPTQVAAP